MKAKLGAKIHNHNEHNAINQFASGGNFLQLPRRHACFSICNYHLKLFGPYSTTHLDSRAFPLSKDLNFKPNINSRDILSLSITHL